ncbi:5-formyltetrahydrofolate cyclo-ligase [Halioglobus japonicus]|nr:5-formyltetrahydrofolate cyclo-ligase [Halioglobus japonicus]
MNHRVQGQFCQRYSGNPFFTMSDIHSNKAALRSTLRQKRRSLGPAAQDAATKAVTHSVLELPAWSDARRIALYLARDGEIDPSALAALARSQNKQLFLPTLSNDNGLSFAHWDTDDTQTLNRYNIPEPPEGAARCPVSELDIVFLPVVGWDKQGGRLGMGGGYYDRTLAGNRHPVLVGLAHELQQVERIPCESWDIVLDYVATDIALYRCQGG